MHVELEAHRRATPFSEGANFSGGVYHYRVETEEQHADFPTKLFSNAAFFYHRYFLMTI